MISFDDLGRLDYLCNLDEGTTNPNPPVAWIGESLEVAASQGNVYVRVSSHQFNNGDIITQYKGPDGKVAYMISVKPNILHKSIYPALAAHGFSEKAIETWKQRFGE